MFYDEDGIYVVDNFISEESQNFIEDLFFKNVDFPYYFNSSTNGTNIEDNPRVIVNRNTFEQHQFTHLLFWIDEEKYLKGDEDAIRKSDWHDTVINVFKESLYEFFGTDEFDILRMKVNLNTSHPKNRKFISPHVDTQIKTWSLIYYVNDVQESETLIGKELFDGTNKNKFVVSRKIKSKKGRCVLFDSRRFHSAGKCPPNKIRVVLNIVLGKLDDL